MADDDRSRRVGRGGAADCRPLKLPFQLQLPLQMPLPLAAWVPQMRVTLAREAYVRGTAIADALALVVTARERSYEAACGDLFAHVVAPGEPHSRGASAMAMASGGSAHDVMEPPVAEPAAVVEPPSRNGMLLLF